MRWLTVCFKVKWCSGALKQVHMNLQKVVFEKYDARLTWHQV